MDMDPLKYYLEEPTRERFAVLLEKTEDLVYRAARKVVENGHLAEDVTQDVYVHLLRSRRQASKIRSGPAFLTSLTVSAARTRLRGEARRRERETTAAWGKKWRATKREAQDDHEALHRAVARLPGAMKRCVDLRYFGDLGTDEIARSLGISRGAVQLRLRKAYGVLRERLTGAQAALILPALLGTGTARVAASEGVSPGLQRKLEEVVARHPGRPRISHAWLVSAATSLVVLSVVATLLPWEDPQGILLPRLVAKNEPVAGGASDRGELGRGAPEWLAVGGNSAGKASPGVLNLPASRDRPEASLEIRVVDQGGRLVPRGRLFLSVVDDRPPEEREEDAEPAVSDDPRVALAAEEKLLPEELSLEDGNPVAFDEVPEALLGKLILASAASEGYLPAEIVRFRIEGGEAVRVSLVLRYSLSAEIAVRDAVSGKPVEGARVELAPHGSQASLEHMLHFEAHDVEKAAGVTDANGVYVAWGLAPRKYFLNIEAPGYHDISTDPIDPFGAPVIWLHPVAPGEKVEVKRGLRLEEARTRSK